MFLPLLRPLVHRFPIRRLTSNPLPPSLTSRLTSLKIPSTLHPQILSTLKQGGIKTISEINNFPDAGLLDLAKTLKPIDNLSNITLKIHLPSSQTFELSSPINSTLYTLSQHSPILHDYLPFSCSGVTSCSTCHVYIIKGYEKPSDSELDMLELSEGYEEGKSRLGCCVEVKEGMEVVIPDGFKDYWS